MNRFLKLGFILVVFLLGSACSPKPSPYKARVGQPAPFTTLTMLDGSQVPLHTLRGRKVVIMLWATWCHTSRPLLTEFNDLAKAYAMRSPGGGAGRGDTIFLAVSLDSNEKLSAVRDRINFGKLTAVQHVYSGNAEYDEVNISFGSGELPHFVVIDRNGIIIAEGGSLDVVENNL